MLVLQMYYKHIARGSDEPVSVYSSFKYKNIL